MPVALKEKYLGLIDKSVLDTVSCIETPHIHEIFKKGGPICPICRDTWLTPIPLSEVY